MAKKTYIDKKAFLEKELEVVKSSFEAEGKTFSRWMLIPYDRKSPNGEYILIAEAEWLDELENFFEATHIIADRMWHLAKGAIQGIAYILTDYNPERLYGADYWEYNS